MLKIVSISRENHSIWRNDVIRYVVAALLLAVATSGGPAAAITIEGASAVDTVDLLPIGTLDAPLQLSGASDGEIGTLSSNLAPFDINIVAGPTLAGNAAALAAFQRAADLWEARISDSITVNIDADLANLGNPQIIGQAGSVILQGGYNLIRDAMVADAAAEADDAIVASLPTAAQFSALLPSRFRLLAELTANKSTLKALGFTGLDAQFGASDATITFNSQFNFDFDNSNGVGGGQVDFETVAAHEIGHALGFTSIVDAIDAVGGGGGPPLFVAPRVLDLFRFENDVAGRDPTNAGEFTTFPRFLAPGGDGITDFITPVGSEAAENRMSTGSSQGDGRQASHWKDNGLTGVLIGVMDPTLALGQIFPMTDADFRALDVIGYDIDVLVSTEHRWNTTAASGLWSTAGNWDATGVPASDWDAIVENTQAIDQTAVVSGNSTVDTITISGVTNSMTVHVQSGVDLAATTEVVVDALGLARVDGTLATDRLDVNGGGSVRVELSSPGTNHISADDDVNVAAGATLTIDAGTPPPTGAQLFPIIQADADSAGGGLVGGTFDTVNLPGDDGLGRRFSLLYENRAVNGVGVVDTVKVGLARPGDADFNSVVDAVDLFAASPFFGTTTPATWRQGNWNDTGSSKGIVDAIDLLDAGPFFGLTYGGGELGLAGDVTTPGQSGDGNPSIIYDFGTGEILIDTEGNTINTYVLDSLAGIFAGFANHNPIGGTIFVTANANRIAENFHANLNGVHSLGLVAQPFLNQAFLLADLTLQGGASGQANFEFDLVMRNTPEPSTVVLLAIGLVGLVAASRFRRRPGR